MLTLQSCYVFGYEPTYSLSKLGEKWYDGLLASYGVSFTEVQEHHVLCLW